VNPRTLGEQIARTVHPHASTRRLLREVYLHIHRHCRRYRFWRDSRHTAYRIALATHRQLAA
jgi:hypothetical protein